MSQLEFYPGFAWAVPRAFAAAVHACRFEQGDVLYSDPAAYSARGRKKRPAQFHIQVLDPPRTTRALAGSGEGQRFFSNWESLVRFEWKDYRSGDVAEHSSTQGQLFTCLWKGDADVLLGDRVRALERPLLLRDLQSRLDEFADGVVQRLAVGGKKTPEPRQLFVSAVDQSSDASRVKAQSIVSALRAQFDIEVDAFRPVDLASEAGERFHPALVVVSLTVKNDSAVELEGVLREVLYAGGKGKDGRFQLARHGSLREL